MKRFSEHDQNSLKQPEILGQITLYNADCMDILREMPDKAFDLAIVDPPYGLGEKNILKNRSRSIKARSQEYIPFSGWDAEAPAEDFFAELHRVSRNRIIWGANHFISRIPFDSSCWIVWDKQNGENDFADCELAWTSFRSAVRIFRFRWQGMLQGNMKHKEKRIHPTQKPVALYRWLLANYAKPGEKILDTHLGSGSIAIACDMAGLSLTGIELDPEYYQAAKKRLIAHRLQQKLF